MCHAHKSAATGIEERPRRRPRRLPGSPDNKSDGETSLLARNQRCQVAAWSTWDYWADTVVHRQRGFDIASDHQQRHVTWYAEQRGCCDETAFSVAWQDDGMRWTSVR